MLTRIAPIFAVAYCSRTHSGQLGDQMPTRSPAAIPAAIRPLASASASAFSCAYVQRWPLGTSTSASRPPKAAAVASRLAPIVSPISG